MDITPHQALKRMRELTEAGVPFSIVYQSLNKTKGSSVGFKTVNKAMLRHSYRDDQSDIAHQLVSYTDLEENKPRHFYACLLLKFNDYTIKP